MNPLLYKEIHFQSVKYIINGQSTNINVFLLFCSFVFLQNWEREEEWYIKFGYNRRNGPKVTYLIFRRGSTGESFFFHGLIDFMLFLTLAWRTWVPHVQDMFLSSSPGVMAIGLSATSPAQKLTFLLIFFAYGEKGTTSVLGSQPIIWLLPPSPWYPATWGY